MKVSPGGGTKIWLGTFKVPGSAGILDHGLDSPYVYLRLLEPGLLEKGI